MKGLRYGVLGTYIMVGTSIQLFAQEKNFAPWVMPAMIHRFDQKASAMVQLAYTPFQNSSFVYLLGTYRLNKLFSVSAGYFRLDADTDEKRRYAENDVIVSGIAAVSVPHVTFEYRNMSMAVVPDTQDLKVFNRSRLRLMANDFSKTIKPYAFWEAYYSFSDKYWYRRRRSVGLVANTSATTQLDLAYIRQQQQGQKDLHLLFVQFLFTF